MYPKILLVDDIPMFLEIQRQILEPLPVQVALATGGREALRLADRLGPDLVVLDMNMPELDGVACCRALKRHREHRRIPIIMTVSDFGCDAELCLEAGCDTVLRKPLEAGRFLEAVTCLIPGLERRDRRLPLLRPVRVRSGGRSFGGALLNISKSGACLDPDETVKLGAPVELSFELSSTPECRFELRGRVVRLQPPDARGMQGEVGVAFVPDALPHMGLDLFIKAGLI